MTNENMKSMVNALTDEELIRQCIVLEKFFNVFDTQELNELTIIDEINELEMIVKDRIVERFIELHKETQT